MAQSAPTLSPDWVKQAREYFQTFLAATRFPHPVRDGVSGRAFTYPEWLVMFIAVVAVKGNAKTYPEIHRLTLQYWEIIAEGTGLPPISESQLRYRLKKIAHHPERPAEFIFQIFPPESLEVVQEDTNRRKRR